MGAWFLQKNYIQAKQIASKKAYAALVQKTLHFQVQAESWQNASAIGISASLVLPGPVMAALPPRRAFVTLLRAGKGSGGWI